MAHVEEKQEKSATENINLTKGPVNHTTSEEIEMTLGIDQESTKYTRKLILYSLISIVIVAGIIWGRNLSAGPEVPNYLTEQAIYGDLVIRVSATGDLQAVNTVEVGSEISGLIKSVYVDYNDQVMAGQLLAKLDTERLEAEVARARAALHASEASLLLNRASLEEQHTKNGRNQELAQQSMISQQELEGSQAALARAEAAVANAQAQIVSNQAALNMAESNRCPPIRMRVFTKPSITR